MIWLFPIGNIPSPAIDMCAQDAAKVHFDIDTSFFPIFNIIFGQHSRPKAL